MSFQMDTPVFSLARHRELLAVARAEERQKIVVALEIEANSLGGAVGAALRAIADQVNGSIAKPAVAMPVAAMRVVQGQVVTYDASYDAADDLDVPFADLTPEQQRRRSLKRRQEADDAASRMSAANKAENERIAADRARMKELVDSGQWNPDTDPPIQSPYGERTE